MDFVPAAFHKSWAFGFNEQGERSVLDVTRFFRRQEAEKELIYLTAHPIPSVTPYQQVESPLWEL